MSHVPKLDQEFWTIYALNGSDMRVIVKPWKGVVTSVYNDAKNTTVQLSPIDPGTGKPDTAQKDSVHVDGAELYCSALDAWVAYENSLLDDECELKIELDKAATEIKEAARIIEKLLQNENRICHLSLKGPGLHAHY